MDISNYIKDILYTHSQVSIPEFGAFIRTTESAKIDGENGKIQAPTTHINFDNSIKNDDNILTNYLVQNGGILPEEGKKLIDNYVAELKKKLEAGESEDFDQIGSVKYDTNKAIVFTKKEKSTFLPNTFALNELKVEPIIEEEIPVKEETKKPIWIWIAIAAAVLIILILVFPVRDYMNNKKTTADTEETSNNGNNDILQDDTNLEEDKTINEDEISENNTTEDVSDNTELKFHIVAGSFGEAVNAENLKLELTKKGYSATVLPKEGEWYRVSMAGFADRKEAEAEMKKINSANLGYDIWLFAK